ncbi:MAG: DEAD/DEAH box helicase family protein [Candidatus Peregrinibacteria bacterium]
MRIELKPFQEDAARKLLSHVKKARKGVLDEESQAIILSSPTGSGKTVILTQLIEWILKGDEETDGDKEAVFLWLSDMPELNVQSRDKIRQQSSEIPESALNIIESPFNEERLMPGMVYFLNTQKLAKDTLLTKVGDGREHTIWQIIENTVKTAPDHLYMIIDEAHRGMAEGREREKAASIMQRFIVGYPEGGMRPVPLIVGMSATPERFQKLIEKTDRVQRPCTIDPEQVKESGLLKDRIILWHPRQKQSSDMTLLADAAKRWLMFSKEWHSYCKAQKMEDTVEPVLVIQVEDGTEKKLSSTDLEAVVRTVESVTGKLPAGAWAHAFQEDKPLEINGKEIRKVDASKIQTEPKVRIVLFKMSLSTGWDCPRAEVLMSFRKAKDATFIAQLVGRMVRTPLARRIEGSELLNAVSLYLPSYDEENVKAIINKLSSQDPEQGATIEVQDGSNLVRLVRDHSKEKLFAKLETLPTYHIERIAKSPNVRRLLKFARALTNDTIDKKAWDEAKEYVLNILGKELAKLKKKKEFLETVEKKGAIEVRESWLEYGEKSLSETHKYISITASPENIDDLFDQCGRKLGEGLHMEYWRSQKNQKDPIRPKLEIIALLQEESTEDLLEELCGKELEKLWKANAGAIHALPSGREEEYRIIMRRSKAPFGETLRMPTEMDLPKEDKVWEKHLYISEKGKFSADLNKWESRVVSELIEQDKSVLGWLRVLPRKDWSLCIPYHMENVDKPLYPDIIAFRSEKGKMVADIFDPHGSHIDDAFDKAKGLSTYAKNHGEHYGRMLLMIIDDKDRLRSLDLNKEGVRNEVDTVTSKGHLEKLFADMG